MIHRRNSKPKKKKTLLKGLKGLFSGKAVNKENAKNRKKARSSSSLASGLSCSTRTVINSLGTVSINDDGDDDYEGYGNYEEFKGYSSSDFLEDGSSSFSQHDNDSDQDQNNNRNLPLHSEEFVTGEASDNLSTRHKYLNELHIVQSTISRGKAYYRQRLYQDAIDQQLQASKLLQSIVCNHKPPEARLNYQVAMVEYEISKSKHALLSESSTNQSENIEEKRIVALNEMRNKKRNLLNKKVIYCRDELLRLDDGGGNRSNDCDLNLERAGYILYLLHTLGDISAHKLARYSSALNYYDDALELEIKVLLLLERQDDDVNSIYNDETEMKRRRSAIQATRKKIGRLHYLTGRLDLALTKIFPCDETSPEFSMRTE